jgi:hypothetical protein
MADQILQRWGGYGNWRSADQDQAAALARLFEANGITDLDKLQITPRAYEIAPQSWESEAGTLTDSGRSGTAFDVTYDGRPVSFLGNVNRDGSLSMAPGIGEPGHGMGALRGNGDLLAWSAAGGGNTSFLLRQDPRTGQVAVVPVWGSSKQGTFDDLRGIANIAALAAGGYYAGAGGAAGNVAQGALMGQGTATGLAMLGDGDVVKAGLAGAVTGAVGGGINGLGQQYGWSPATTRAVSGATNAALRGGDGADILKAAASGYLQGGGQSLGSNYLPGGDMKLEQGFFDRGGAGFGGGGSGMDFSGYFDNSLYDFGGGAGLGSGWSGIGWSGNVFGDSFGNSPTDFGKVFGPGIYDFGQTFDARVPDIGGSVGAGTLPDRGGIDWGKLGDRALNWLLNGGGDGKGAPGWAMLAGALMGASNSRNGSTTQTRDPWGPAQPFLLNQLQRGADLQRQYAAQPFSPAQQTAYGNVGGLLDFINANAAGLIAGPQFTPFVRGQAVSVQRPALTGRFQPAGLLGYLGSR